MSIQLLEAAAAALGDLLAEVVFVGGATVEPWITDPGDHSRRCEERFEWHLRAIRSWASRRRG